MQADRLEARRFANNRRATQHTARCSQGLGTCHGALFVAGGEDDERLLERLIEQRLKRLDGQREKALHVAAAQSYPVAVDFGQLERIGLPQRIVVRNGIAVARQHQPAGASAKRRQQIELAGAYLLDVAGETQIAQPARQQVNDGAIGLVERGLRTAHRRRGDQGGELVFHGRQRHRRLR